jgi:hypothetical protein
MMKNDMQELIPKDISSIYQQIREVLIQARSRALRAVNAEMVVCYWEIGRLIVEEEQQGKTRAVYGKGLIKELSGRLTDEFGRGFHQRNLWFMRNFYLAYPKVNALRSELSWTHYRLLLRAKKQEARAFYEAEDEPHFPHSRRGVGLGPMGRRPHSHFRIPLFPGKRFLLNSAT